jgi:hypothetical protein
MSDARAAFQPYLDDETPPPLLLVSTARVAHHREE